jgi:hypothetical protein
MQRSLYPYQITLLAPFPHQTDNVECKDKEAMQKLKRVEQACREVLDLNGLYEETHSL